MSTEQTTSSSVRLPRLGDPDVSFLRWKHNVRGHLKAEGLEELLTTSPSVPTDAALPRTLTVNKAKAIRVIRNSINAENDDVIGDTDKPKDSWATLLAKHGSSDGVVTAAILSQIKNARLEPGQSILSFISHIQSLHNQLADFTSEDPDMKISSKMLGIFLLNALPKDWFGVIRQHFFSNLKTLKCADVLN